MGAMNHKFDVYLYGMTLLSSSHLLASDFPALDTYGEIRESHTLPGGETGTCAAVLRSFGCSVKIDGNWQGTETYGKLMELYGRIGVDASRLRLDETFSGLRDLVLIDRRSRTAFGTFQAYFADPLKRWSEPRKEDIEDAAVVGIDPFFFEQSLQAARYCRELGKKFVTIDCRHDSDLNRFSEVNAVSNEFLSQNYPGEEIGEIYKKYTGEACGLVIFTFGVKNLLYGRRGQRPKSFAPYRVEAVSTLGAGDTFKAGAIYAVLKGMDDEGVVRFASAAAAAACMDYPIFEKPPTLKKINGIINGRA
jgi:sugar/nucleoside kinase (ribokinase family)